MFLFRLKTKIAIQAALVFEENAPEIETGNSFRNCEETAVDEELTYRQDRVTIAVARYSPGPGNLIACL